MNKKFSTLWMAALLTSAFASAQTSLVKVEDPSTLKLGEKYVISDLKGDSILYFDATSGEYDKAKFKEATVESAAESDYFKVVANGKSFWKITKGSAEGHGLYANAVAGPYYFNVDNSHSSLVINEDGSIKITASTNNGTVQFSNVSKFLSRDKNGVITTLDEAADSWAKFAFWTEDKNAGIAGTSAKINVAQTLHLVIDGEFIVAAEPVTKANVATGLKKEATLTDPASKYSLWISKDGGLFNLGAQKYLSFNGSTLSLAENQVSFEISTPFAIINGKNAGVTDVRQTTAPLPYNGAETVVEAKKGELYAICVEGEFVKKGNALAYPLDNKDFESLWIVEQHNIGKDQYRYYFKNKKDESYLTVSDKKVYAVADATLDGTVLLQISDTEFITAALTSTTVKGQAATFGFVDAGTVLITAEELRAVYGDSFEMTITTTDDKAVEGTEAFAGVLKPVYYSNGEIGAVAPGSPTFALANADGKLIVMDKGDKYANVSGSDYGYKFKLFTPEALRRAIIDDKNNGRYQTDFSIRFKAGQLAADVNVVEIVYCDRNSLGLLTVNGKKYLSAGNDYDELDPVKIKLVNNNVVDPTVLLKDATFFNVSYLNSKKYSNEVNRVSLYNTILGLNDKGEAAFVAKTKTQQSKPEGQWAIQYDEDNKTYTFVNRENGAAFDDVLQEKFLYKTNKPNVYAYVHPAISGWVNSDTISIVPVATTEADGFARWENAINTLYNMGVYSSVREDAIWTAENHKANHVIGLEKEAEDATAWRLDLNTYIFTDKYDDKFVKVDTVYIPTKLSYWHVESASKKYWDVKTDTLKLLSYSLMNQDNEEYVGYDNAERAYACNDGNARFVFKEVGDQYNVIQLTDTKWDVDTDHYRYVWNEARKIYGGDSANKGLLDFTTNVYDKIENDLFVVEPTEAPLYRTITPFDTISIYRQDNNKQMLFEDGEFLGLKNATQFEIKPAMFVDTAYVRNETYRPQYMLMFNPDITPAGKWCEEHQSATCEHAVDTKGWIEGRYLVNLKDSAIAYEDLHTNKYINTENYYKLGFVQATHKNDSLVIESTGDSIFVGNAHYNVAKFAFRIVDNESKAFKIETANYYTLDNAKAGELSEYKPYGYIKWMNGVVVVVDDIRDADIFNLNADEEGNPTANDEIAAESVSVIATNGAVIVKGAEGKNVVITNVLGQQVANTVVTSSEATIAAPAGIVVVAVEGEAAVKAIVK